ncbi:MAG: PAS domain-containing protein [Richelia sp. SM2_1_7]|nr:PAS domain-containing protein [Richelia sp. SM2_1_7]
MLKEHSLITSDNFIAIANVLPEPMLLVDSEGEIVAINKAVTKMLGIASKNLQNAKLFDLVSESFDTVIQYLKACSRSRQWFLVV